jgi:hypothetical protein
LLGGTQANRAGQGKSGKDLEIGAVDELLVGEFMVRAKDKERKTLRWFLPWLLGSPLILLPIIFY